MTAPACWKAGFSLSYICAANQARTYIHPTICSKMFAWIVALVYLAMTPLLKKLKPERLTAASW